MSLAHKQFPVKDMCQHWWPTLPCIAGLKVICNGFCQNWWKS